MTLRDLLAQNSIDLDQELENAEVKWSRPAVEGPPVGLMRTHLPGPVITVDIHLTIAARD